MREVQSSPGQVDIKLNLHKAPSVSVSFLCVFKHRSSTGFRAPTHRPSSPQMDSGCTAESGICNLFLHSSSHTSSFIHLLHHRLDETRGLRSTGSVGVYEGVGQPVTCTAHGTRTCCALADSRLQQPFKVN
jgi:hypothetical protein